MSIVWLTVGCSSYGIHFSAKFVGYNVFVTTAIKEVVVIITILILVPIYERVSRGQLLCILTSKCMLAQAFAWSKTKIMLKIA